MQVLAHSGPNWTPGSLCVHPVLPLVAIAVRNSVLLYSKQGQFEGELRSIGRNRVSALSFCSAPALTSFLAVGTSDGHLRIYDIPSRRIFRRIRQGPASNSILNIQFIPSSPHLILVAYTKGVVEIIPYAADTQPYKPIFSKKLPYQPFFVYPLPSKSPLIITAGNAPKKGHVLQVFSLKSETDVTTISYSQIVHDVAIRRRRDHKNPNNGFVDVAYAPDDGASVVVVTSRDCRNWTCLAKGCAENPVQTISPEETVEEKKDMKSLRISICFDKDDHLVTSDPRGAVFLWRIKAPYVHVEVVRQDAHMRQIFAITTDEGNKLYSISMDRTFAIWNKVTNKDKPKILLRYRTIRVDGVVGHLTLSKVISRVNLDPSLESIDEKDLNFLLFSSTSGIVTSVIWGQHGLQQVLGELSPFGTVVGGKRAREEISCLRTSAPAVELDHSVTNLAFVGSSKGRIGSIIMGDGQLNFVSFRKKKSQKSYSNKPVKNVIGVNDLIISINNHHALTNWKQVEKHQSDIQNNYSDDEYASFKLHEIQSTLILKDVKEKVTCFYSFIRKSDVEEILHFVGLERGVILILNNDHQKSTRITIPGFSNIVSISFHPSMQFLALAGSDKELCVAKLNTGIIGCNGDIPIDRIVYSKTIVGTDGVISRVEWAPCSKLEPPNRFHLFSAHRSGAAFVWEYDGGTQLGIRAELKETHGKLSTHVWCNNKFLLTGGHDGTVRSWEIERLPRYSS